uniref:Uncharacterized protein n=1 Tax=Aegilops tauschii subsp. strangulata TaxID=200361 RepID=A0A453QY81_AEGTS
LSFCLYAAGHGAAHAVGTGSSGSKQRSGAMDGWALDSNAREAKERLDQKLKSNGTGPDTVIKRWLLKLIDADARFGFFLFCFTRQCDRRAKQRD